MIFTELNNGKIGDLLKKYDLSKIKTYKSNTLFEVIDMSLLKQGRCIYCGNKLIIPRGKNIAICYGKRHSDKNKFVVKLNTLGKITAKKTK